MRLIFSAALLLTAIAAAAQDPLVLERRVAPFEVQNLNGETLPYPFAGGFIAPRPALVDLDADGRADLVVNEGGQGLAYYRNVGASGPGEGFAWQTDALEADGVGIAPGTWFAFGDLDGDGDLDLMTQGAPGRIRYYRNTGTPQSAAFTLAADTLMAAGGLDPVTNEDTSVPALADVDGDGDLDFLHGQADRGHITFWRHDGVSGGLPQFTFVTADWEDIEVFEESPSCEDPKGPTIGTGRGTLHGANALTFVDLDADGDREFFWGDFFARSLFFFRNTGTPQNPDFTLISEVFPLDEPLTSGGYNVPNYGDLDGDGDPDLLIGILGGLCSTIENKFDNLYLYENTGTPQDAAFALRTERLIESLDVGERAVPALADFDGDGDLDLVVGNDPLGLLGSQLNLFENQGTDAAPAFRLTDPDWLGLEYDFGAYAPAFADMDADGDLDLLVGGFNGRLAFLRNTGSPTSPSYTLEEERFGNIDVGQYIRPAFGDLDGDGDLDLLTGESNGLLKIYRNAGTPQAPAFQTEANGSPTADDLAFRDAIGLGLDVGMDSAPTLRDVDGDGDLDVLVGTQDGTLRFFRNTGSATNPSYAEEAPVLAYRPSTTPVFGDLDGDGDLDLLAGNRSGGLLYFANLAVTSGAAPGAPDRGSLRLRVVPNPSAGRVVFRLDGPRPTGGLTLAVYDSLGRAVWEQDVPVDAASVEWASAGEEAEAVASGVYVVRLVTADRVLASASFTRLR